MHTLHVFELIPRKVLVARSSAREIATAVETALSEADGTIELDFSGIEAVSPSFVDEILAMVQEILDRTNVELDQILVSRPPTRLSSKFEALGRGRSLHIAEGADSVWVLTPEVAEDAPTP